MTAVDLFEFVSETALEFAEMAMVPLNKNPSPGPVHEYLVSMAIDR